MFDAMAIDYIVSIINSLQKCVYVHIDVNCNHSSILLCTKFSTEMYVVHTAHKDLNSLLPLIVMSEIKDIELN